MPAETPGARKDSEPIKTKSQWAGKEKFEDMDLDIDLYDL